jgi:hypothetical protein
LFIFVRVFVLQFYAIFLFIYLRYFYYFIFLFFRDLFGGEKGGVGQEKKLRIREIWGVGGMR